MKRYLSAIIFVGLVLAFQPKMAQAGPGVSGILGPGNFFQDSTGGSNSFFDPKGLNIYHNYSNGPWGDTPFTTPDDLGTYSTPVPFGTGTITNTYPGLSFGSGNNTIYFNDPIYLPVRFGSTTPAMSSPARYNWARITGQVASGYQGYVPPGWTIYPGGLGGSEELMGGTSIWSVSNAGQNPHNITINPVTSTARYSGGRLSVAITGAVTNVNNFAVGGPRGTLQADLTTSVSFAWLEAGNTQSFPILPSSTSNGSFSFFGVPSNRWYDPITVPEFQYDMLNGSLFTKIEDFPTGFNSPFTVKVGSTTIGNFLPGESVDFQALLGGGVTSFSVSGINPGADPTSTTAFPLKISFNTPTADFKMTGISAATAAPEPGTLTLIGLGLSLGAGKFCKRRKK
jgi:hypothetical protein